MNFLVTRPIRSLENEFENFFGDLESPFSTGAFARGFAPPLDLVETAEGFTLRAELPGVERKDVELSVHEGVLTLKGEKKGSEERKEDRWYRRETWSGSFERSLSLPDSADPEKVGAEMKDGVLTVSIGKREESKPRSIAING